MSDGKESMVYYFDEKGPVNTEKTLEIALAFCKARDIGQVHGDDVR